MKKSILFCLMTLLSVGVFGQNDAKTLIQQVRKNTLALQDQSIDFTNTIDAPTGDKSNPRVKRQLKGKAISKGNKYRLELGGQIIFINDSKAYIVSPDDGEITVRKLSEDNSVFSPEEILKKYEKNSSMKLAGKSKENGIEIQYILIKPKASEEIKEIQLGINMKTKLLYSYQENGTNGVISTFRIDKYTTNSGVSEATVTFNKADYSDFEIFEPRGK